MIAFRIPSPSPSSPRLNRWLLGTAAFGSATAVQADIVQIDLAGNKASIDGMNFVNNTFADITGDGTDDFDSSNFFFERAKVKGGGFGVFGYIAGYYVSALAQRFSSVRAQSTSNVSQGNLSTFSSSTEYRVNAGSSARLRDPDPLTQRNFIPVSFTDARINGGVKTNALLEVRAANLDFDSHEIELVRVVFDDAEPGAKFEASLDTQYPLWGAVATSSPLPRTISPLEKKIAVLEKRIRKAKAAARPNTPRLNFYGTQASRIRLIAALERKLAVLKRKQRGRA